MTKKNEWLTIQEPVPAFESYRLKLSASCWAWGLGNFFIQDIPQGFSTGVEFAENLADAFNTYLEDTMLDASDEPLYTIEFGAGTSVLSKNFLDILQRKYPYIYQRLHHTISDISVQNIQDVKRSKILVDHEKHYSIEICDITAKKLKLKKQAHFIFFSYLLDSIDTRHFTWKNQNLCEQLITTKIKQSASIIDTTVYPPKLCNADNIKEILKSNDEEKKRCLSTQILPLLKETYITLSDLDSSTLSSKEKDFYDRIKTTLPYQENHVINLSFLHQRILKNIYDISAKNALIITRDVGHSKLFRNTKSKRTLSMKAATYFPLCFPYLSSLATELKYEIILSKESKHFSEVNMILLKGKYSKKAFSKFKYFFTNSEKEKESLNIGKKLESFTHTDELKKYIPIFVREVPYKKHHFLVNYIVVECIQAGFFAEAISILKTSEILYPFYIRFLYFQAFCYYQLGVIKTAQTILDQLFDYCPHYLSAIELQLQLYLDRNDTTNSIKWIKTILKYQNREQVIYTLTLLHHLLPKNSSEREKKSLKKILSIVS